MSLRGKILFITGASRGIGKEIAIRAGRDGAKVAIAAKTVVKHDKLPGTIYSAAEDIKAAGGEALPLQCDIRDEDQVKEAIEKTVETFGGIDIVVNNASAIFLNDTENTPVKRYDLMYQVNSRGSWLVSKYAIPYLKKSKNGQILMLSPELDMKEKWFSSNVAYSVAKFGMSMNVLGLAGELRKYGISVNALWPVSVIETAALKMIDGAGSSGKIRKPKILSDAAHYILTRENPEFTGKFLLDEIILRESGVTDFEQYNCIPNTPLGNLEPDFFVSKEQYSRLKYLRSIGAKKSHL